MDGSPKAVLTKCSMFLRVLAMQKVNVPKEQINCTFSTLQNMLHLVRTAFGDPYNTYGGDIWSIPLKPHPIRFRPKKWVSPINMGHF